MSTTEVLGELRIMHTRHRKDLIELLKKAGDVVKEGAEVGGDVRVAWDPDNEAECTAVGKLFEELQKHHFTAVKVGDDGKLKDGAKITKFDSKAGRMVMIPQMVGGSK